jgi:eukaryotic-like serine/threonine-protein kinase
MVMVKISGGEFMMGSITNEEGKYNNEEGKYYNGSYQHQVRVPEFYIGQTLITQAQWQQLLGHNPSHFTEEGKLPVEKVSWLDTQEFCQKLFQKTQRKYRLPSEAEWEYACRAGTITPFYFGETINSEVANYRAQDREIQGKTYTGKYGKGKLGKFREKTTSVGDFPPNAFGLYDMHGNVWEWCLDHWYQNYLGAPSDGSARLSKNDKANRLLRGGSWNNHPNDCRSATRSNATPDRSSLIIGFRVVCEIPIT